MPLDGLSSSNIGMGRFLTPMENLSQTEHVAKVHSEKNTNKTEKLEKAKNNLDKEFADENQDLQGRDTSGQQSEESSHDFVAGKENLKKYKVKFNPITDMVEFIDKNTGSIIESISPEELLSLVSKSVKPSGILVDREI